MGIWREVCGMLLHLFIEVNFPICLGHLPNEPSNLSSLLIFQISLEKKIDTNVNS